MLAAERRRQGGLRLRSADRQGNLARAFRRLVGRAAAALSRRHRLSGDRSGAAAILGGEADGEGDVTDTNVVWRLTQHVAKTASPILVDGLIYMLWDDGIATAVDAARRAKSCGASGSAANSPASPIYGDGRLYFCDQQGVTTLVKPGREYEALASNTLDDGLMASPAVDGKSLFLRTKTHLYRIEVE